VIPSNLENSFYRRHFWAPRPHDRKDRLPELRKQHAVDLVIANCENAAAGFGITPSLAEELFDLVST